MPTDRTPLPTDIRTEAAGTWDPERPTGEMAAVDIGSVPDAASSRYAFVGMVGKGAMGEVKLAHDLQLQRPVAFKQMSAAIASRPQLALRFFQEAQVTAQLDHPNIVPVYGLERTPEGDLAYTMKLVQGITLEELMDEVRAAIEAGEPVPDDMDLESRLEHFVKICDALAYAHARGVIHRDLKPANVMVGAYHEIYVMDWGIAKILSVDDAGLTEFVDHLGSTTDLVVKQTQLGRAVGTPAYMSPEQANGQNDTLGPASDQFALGLMLYELITLDRAYKGTGVSVVMLAQNAAVRLPRKTADGTALPSDLAAILRKATRKKPEHRYASVDELADEVRRYLRGEETLARPDNVFRRLARVLQAYREAALVLMLLLVIVAGGVTVLGLAGVTAVRYASAVRQERLAQTITLVHDRASSANDYFLELQGLLEALSESAEVTLQDARPDADSPLYRSADYADPDRSPPDTVVTERYGEDAVNFRWPVFKLAPGVDADAVEPELRKLIRLRRTLRSNLLRSHSEDAVKMSDPQVIRLLGYEGVPIIWSYVATESGIHTSFPGHGPYPDAYDPRARPWYQLGSRNRGPVWGAPYIDVNGRGLILPCVQSLWSDEDELLGVAGIELTFDLVIEDLLRGTAIAGASEAWLTDAQGRVVVGSTDLHTEIGGGLHENKGLALEPLPLPAVIAAMKLRPTGYVEEDGQLTVYSRLDTLDWFLVVTGPEGAMLGGS